MNPLIIKHTFISYNNKTYQIKLIENDSLIIQDNESEILKISENDWRAIRLTDGWVEKFHLKENFIIYNFRTKENWILKKTGDVFYLTINRDDELGENPVIGLYYVHDLQRWYNRLTGNYLMVK